VSPPLFVACSGCASETPGSLCLGVKYAIASGRRLNLLPSDEIVVDSPLTVHEATVALRAFLPGEFGELGKVREVKAGDAVEVHAVRDWSDARGAFRLQLTLRPAPSGSRIVILMHGRPGSVAAEAALAVSACSVVFYKTGWSPWSVLVVAMALVWLPYQLSLAYRAERDRLRPGLLRAIGL